jgi:hypothetical protein
VISRHRRRPVVASRRTARGHGWDGGRRERVFCAGRKTQSAPRSEGGVPPVRARRVSVALWVQGCVVGSLGDSWSTVL